MSAPALATRAGLLTCAFYAAIFTAIGAHLPFWPVWLADWGLSEAEVGLYLGAGLVLRIAASAGLGALADRLAARRAILAGASLAAAAVFALHLAVETRAALFVLTLMVTATLSPMIPLGEALGLRAARMHAFPYAHARAAGSIAFLLSNLAVGWAIARTGPDAALYTLAGACLVAALLAAVHPGGGAPPGSDGVADSARLKEGVGLLARPRLALFTLAHALGQSSFAVYYLYGSLDWARQGIAPGTIGALWATGVIAETALMLGPGRLWVMRLGAAGALALGAGASVVRWGAMTVEPALWALWPLQALHALGFGLAHLAVMAFMAEALPLRLQASGQGVLVALMTGIGMALATLAAGEIRGAFGIEAAWGLAVALSAASLALALALHGLGRAARA